MNRIIAAAAVTIAVWGLTRLLGRRFVRNNPEQHHSPTERWENEGGALSSPAWTQTSKAPR
jgi:hypothetical protein